MSKANDVVEFKKNSIPLFPLYITGILIWDIALSILTTDAWLQQISTAAFVYDNEYVEITIKLLINLYELRQIKIKKVIKKAFSE